MNHTLGVAYYCPHGDTAVRDRDDISRYRRSSAMARLFGEEGTSVVTKLSAFLLLCIGVQIMITGWSRLRGR
nr:MULTISPECIES: MarC family protein [unclassified Bradyrhizobium]